ncbi:hypothetical protein KI387_034737 [Taxus chinensis]|uniref:Protein EXECUTER 1, chloroplastic n=1 Tax=Taxus chinensis TaxID=29808 RepID=A0AA38F6D1_TAXCH|nr:hypothetical protein KI387_034737 [Taxus chinensis]
MGVTAVAPTTGTGFVQASLPFRSNKGNSISKRTQFHSIITTKCCSASKEGDNRAISSSSSSSNLISHVGKRLQSYLENYRDKHQPPKINANNTNTEWDWDRWEEHFSEIEKYETLASALKFQLEEAIESEDFQQAFRLKKAIAAATAKDMVAEVMCELEKAIEEERYLDAVQLRDDAGAGLIGWWVGLPQGSNDPYGRIINISPAQGRFVANSYSARQLAAAGTGVPLFEIFVTKDGDLGYKQQAVYLQRARGTSRDSLTSSESVDADLLGSSESSPEGIQKYQGVEISADVETDGDKSDDTDNMDELNRVLNYLRDRIPGIKFKILKVIAPEGVEMDTKIFEQLIQESEEEKDESDSDESSEDETKIEGDLQDGKETIGDANFTEKQKETPFKLVIGGVLPSSSEDKASRVAVRVPARIEYKGRDSFIFHPKENDDQEPAVIDEPDMKVATIAAQSSADLGVSDVVKALWKAKKGHLKAHKDVEEIIEIIRLAFSRARKRNSLSGSSMFQRLNVAEANADPLSGLYVGAFGRHNSEVVQLRRKYGHWPNANESPSGDSKLEFFEYVEAVKLTGDLNVPAGEVTFRAKTGIKNRLSSRGIYPEELGVIARYKSQGRIAGAGFRNPRWIDGELVLLNGKGSGLTEGAELGFVYCVSERHILVLFCRLKLQE